MSPPEEVKMVGCVILIAFMYGPSVTWSYNAGTLVLSSPAIADVDTSSPGSEVIFGGYSGSGVYCLSSSGGLLWFCSVGGGIHASPIIARLGHAKDPAIIAGVTGQKVVCINNDGTIRWQYIPSQYGGSSPIVANIDTVGAPEILFGGSDTFLYCLDSNGGLIWKAQCDEPIYGHSPAVANIDEIGTPEIIITTQSKIYCFNSDSSLRWKVSLPQPAPMGGIVYGVSPSIADVDLDGDAEIVVGDMCFEADGSLRWHYGLSVYSTSAIADLDYDGVPEIVVWNQQQDLIYAIRDSAGLPVVNWTANAVDPSGTSFTTPIICDIMGDSARDVLWVAGAGGNGYLRIYDGNTGAILHENTAFSSQTVNEHGAAAADIDNDGIIEVVAIYGCYGVGLLEDDANWASCDKNRFAGHLYHITEVNPDLSVPNSEPYSWEIHNTWLAQVCEGPPGVRENEKLKIRDTKLELCPNPFTHNTTIRYFVRDNSQVKLKIYDINGSLVDVLVNSEKKSGVHLLTWDRRNFKGNLVGTGIYFCIFECGETKQTAKLIILSP